MSDPWDDSMLVEAFDASIAKYQQMHGFAIVKDDSSSQALEGIHEKVDEGRVDFQPADSEKRYECGLIILREVPSLFTIVISSVAFCSLVATIGYRVCVLKHML